MVLDRSTAETKENLLQAGFLTYDSQLLTKMFAILNKQLKADNAIIEALTLIGDYYDADRCYIFEDSYDHKFCANTYEWCAFGVNRHIGTLWKVSYEDDLGGEYLNYYNDGIFFCPSRAEIPSKLVKFTEKWEIFSILHCAIKENGVFMGFWGMETASEKKSISCRKETLKLISMCLCTLLNKKRAEFTEGDDPDIKSTIDAETDLVYVVNPSNYDLIYRNRAFNNRFEFEENGTKCYEIFKGRTRPCKDCPLNAIDNANRKVIREESFSGGRCFLTVASTIDWYGNEYAALTCIDISDRRQVQMIAAETNALERQYKQALVSNAFGVYEVNLTKDIIFDSVVSDSTKAFDGGGNITVSALPCSYTEYLKELIKILPESEKNAFASATSRERLIKRFNKGERNPSIEYWSEDNQGRSFFLRTQFILTLDNVTGDVLALVVDHDLTDRKKEELRQYKMLENALNKAQIASHAKTQFLTHVSHDIRTPLNAIMGMTSIAKMKLKETGDKEMQECFDIIDESSQHLLSLINDVLDMSKIESGAFIVAREPINASSLVDECVAIIKGRLVNRDIELVIERNPCEYSLLYGDPTHFKQILLNIMGNAIKFTPDGGKVSFNSVSYFDEPTGRVHVRYSVTDTGIGMSKEFLQQMFEPFVQEKRDARTTYQGSGLGMAITKRLVDMMGGTISVESKADQGTTFTVDLPFEVCEQEKHEIPKEPVHEDRDISGKRILLVEDNVLNLEIAKTILKKNGLEVVGAQNGQIAVDIFSSNPEDFFDAILMDIMMPVLDGLSAAKAIRELDIPTAKTVPIIAMTANAFADDIEKSIRAGMNAHLSKPIKTDELFEVLKKYIK